MFEIEGLVTVDGAAGRSVTVSFTLKSGGRLPLGRGVPAPVLTDKSGRFSQGGFDSRRTYTATPSSPGLRFTPARASFDASNGELSFSGSSSTFAASGVVREPPSLLARRGKPPGIPEVTINFIRVAGRDDVPAPPAVTTEANGSWRQDGFQRGATYQAVPIKAGLAFTPASVSVQPGAGSEFTGSSSLFSLSGRVTTAGGAAEPGVTIRFERLAGSGGVPAAVVTDGAGRFSASGFDRASRYRIRPSKRGQTFEPASREVAFAPNALSIANFERRTNLVVTGQVLTTAGAGLLSAVLTFNRVSGNGAVPLPVTTVSNGEYRAEGLDSGTTYRVTGVRQGFGIAPEQFRSPAGGTFTVNLTAFPEFEVAGVVLDSTGVFPFPPSDLPPVSGAVVSFHRIDSGPAAPDPVVTASDGTFRQRGFEVGGSFVATASHAGFVGGTPVLFPFASAPDSLGSASFSHDRAGLLGGIVLMLQEA